MPPDLKPISSPAPLVPAAGVAPAASGSSSSGLTEASAAQQAPYSTDYQSAQSQAVPGVFTAGPATPTELPPAVWTIRLPEGVLGSSDALARLCQSPMTGKLSNGKIQSVREVVSPTEPTEAGAVSSGNPRLEVDVGCSERSVRRIGDSGAKEVTRARWTETKTLEGVSEGASSPESTAALLEGGTAPAASSLQVTTRQVQDLHVRKTQVAAPRPAADASIELETAASTEPNSAPSTRPTPATGLTSSLAAAPDSAETQRPAASKSALRGAICGRVGRGLIPALGSAAGALAGGVETFGLGAAPGAAIGGGLAETGVELYCDGKVDPTRVAITSGAGFLGGELAPMIRGALPTALNATLRGFIGGSGAAMTADSARQGAQILTDRQTEFSVSEVLMTGAIGGTAGAVGSKMGPLVKVAAVGLQSGFATQNHP